MGLTLFPLILICLLLSCRYFLKTLPNLAAFHPYGYISSLKPFVSLLHVFRRSSGKKISLFLYKIVLKGFYHMFYDFVLNELEALGLDFSFIKQTLQGLNVLTEQYLSFIVFCLNCVLVTYQ